MSSLESRVAARYKERKKTDKGNTVYLYSERQISRRNNEKAKRLEQLRKNVHKVRSQVKKDLSSGDPEKVLTALAVGLMDSTAERVGNSESAKEGHYGVTGWTKEHVKFSQGKATVSYVGKSGVKQKKTVSDKALVSALKDAVEACEDGSIFCHETATIDASKVNKYLKKFDITAKDIRGLHANQEMQQKLKAVRKRELPSDPKEKEKKLKDEFKKALEETAKEVGHEPSTLRSQYLVPSMEADFLKDGTVVDRLSKKVATRGPCETAGNLPSKRARDAKKAEEKQAQGGISMKTSVEKKVASRYLEARAIRVDKSGIKDLSRDLAKLIYRKTDGQSPLGDTTINRKPIPYVVRGVDGSVISTSVILKAEVGSGGPYVLSGAMGRYRGDPIVIVYINGSTVIPKNTAGVLEKQLYPVLLHELTHVADKFKGRGPAHDMSQDEAQGSAKYYNDPGEVRAYMQEIVDELEDKVKHLGKLQKAFGMTKGIEYLLKSSDTWQEVSPHWTESNKRKVIKTVVQMINEATASRVAQRTL